VIFRKPARRRVIGLLAIAIGWRWRVGLGRYSSDPKDSDQTLAPGRYRVRAH
jgi:hypothetical protein